MTTTARLSLDRISVVDFDVMWNIHADPLTNEFNPDGPLLNRADAQRQFGYWLGHWHEHGFGPWTVRDDEGVVGFVGIRHTEWNDRPAINLGYRLTPRAWGKGYATEAAAAAVELWQEQHSAHPLIAYTKAANLGSQRTALKVGLERRPDLDRVTDDAFGDDVVFALGWDAA